MKWNWPPSYGCQNTVMLILVAAVILTCVYLPTPEVPFKPSKEQTLRLLNGNKNSLKGVLVYSTSLTTTNTWIPMPASKRIFNLKIGKFSLELWKQ